jgi:hypothetical protein
MGQVTKPAALAILALSVTTSVYALPTADIPTAEPEYLAKVKTAAPEQIVSKSTITMQMKDGTTKTLQSGTNGFTCLILGDGTPVCVDENAMEWRKAASSGLFNALFFGGMGRVSLKCHTPTQTAL